MCERARERERYPIYRIFQSTKETEILLRVARKSQNSEVSERNFLRTRGDFADLAVTQENHQVI